MEKVGMHYEGRLRENFPSEDGTWRDSLLYAIIDHKWRAEQSTKPQARSHASESMV